MPFNPTADQLADVLALPDLPPAVVVAHQAHQALTATPVPPAVDLVSTARVDVLDRVLSEAAVNPVRADRLDVSALLEAQHRQAEADARRQVLIDARAAAASRLVRTAVEHRAELVALVQRHHAAVIARLWELAAGGSLPAADVEDLAANAEHLRRLVQVADGEPMADTWWSWTSGDQVHDLAITLLSARPGPGLWCRIGEFGNAENARCGSGAFYAALARAGVPAEAVWCPTSAQLDARADELHQARRVERALESARR